MPAKYLIVRCGRTDKTLHVFGLLVFACLFLFCQSAFSNSHPHEERLARLKAAYIYNILKFTLWPEGGLSTGGAIQTCIVGNDLVAGNLVTGFKGHRAQGRQIVVRKIDSSIFQDDQHDVLAQLGHCHLIYLSKPVVQHNKQVIALMKGKQALLVSTSEQFVYQGGMVSIVFDKELGQIRFVINLDSVTSSGLAISSKLLKFAKIIESVSVQAR